MVKDDALPNGEPLKPFEQGNLLLRFLFLDSLGQ